MKKVLFLDDDKSLCYLMLELFENSPDVKMVTVNSYAQMTAFNSEINSFDVIFLDVNLGPGCPTGLDGFEWLKKNKFDKKIIFFTGHANAYPLVKDALNTPNVFVLEKPAPIKKIEDLIRN